MVRDSSPSKTQEAPYSEHSVDSVKITNSKIVTAKPNTKKEEKEIVYIMNDDDLVETAKKFITQKN